MATGRRIVPEGRTPYGQVREASGMRLSNISERIPPHEISRETLKALNTHWPEARLFAEASSWEGVKTADCHR